MHRDTKGPYSCTAAGCVVQHKTSAPLPSVDSVGCTAIDLPPPTARARGWFDSAGAVHACQERSRSELHAREPVQYESASSARFRCVVGGAKPLAALIHDAEHFGEALVEQPVEKRVRMIQRSTQVIGTVDQRDGCFNIDPSQRRRQPRFA